MLTDQELQTLRNIGNEAEAAADEIEALREREAFYRAAALDAQQLATLAGEEVAQLRADGARLKRGECICVKCGLRQVSEPVADAGF